MHRRLFCQNVFRLTKAICHDFGEMRCATMSPMPQERCTPLPAFSVVAVTGRDARSYLQGQLTNDLLGLDRHPGLLSAACNREGRVLETLRLAATGEAVSIIVRRALVPALLTRLAKYVLRAQVSFQNLSDTQVVAGLLDAQPDPSWSMTAAAAAGLTMMVTGPRRILLAGSPAALDSALADVDRTDPGDWERRCIEDGEPTVHPETAGHWIPQMLNLDLLGAVSFSKGCYTGQEIVARTQHLGRIKRRMLRYTGPVGTTYRPAQTLYGGESTAAHVVAASDGPGGPELLAVVELRFCGDLLGAKPGGTELVPAELPYLIPAPGPEVDA